MSAIMEGQNAYHSQEGQNSNPLAQQKPSAHANGNQGVQSVGGVQFNTNSFESDNTRVPPSEASTEAISQPRQRTGSRDYSTTDEWDASKVKPSQFQQRKGSIYSTPPSRDGHIQRNNERDAAFHEKHSKKFLGKVIDKVQNAVEGSGQKRKSSSSSKGDKSSPI